MEKATYCRQKKEIISMLFISVLFCTPLCKANYYSQSPSVEHYKMLSTVEYTGQGQFKHQIETQLRVETESLMDNQVQYSVSSNDLDFSGTDSQKGSSYELSFTVDRNSRRLSTNDRNLTILEKVHNHCVQSLQKVTSEEIGKTWKQTFDLSSFDYSLPEELTFTMTAMEVDTETYGQMIAVRALSEPFVVGILRANEGIKNIKVRMNAAYLFDSNIENIYLSISVFEATTNIEASNEKIRYEVATYRTDLDGNAVDLSGLDEDFEKFVRKVGLTNKTLKITKEVSLPLWARTNGLFIAQVSNVCAAASCEGALNPVATICIPLARTIELQSLGQVVSAVQIGTIGGILANSIPAMGGMKIAVAPAFLGVGLQGAGLIAGATVGTVAVAGGFDSDDDEASPTTP